jgi:hypothetical protein
MMEYISKPGGIGQRAKHNLHKNMLAFAYTHAKVEASREHWRVYREQHGLPRAIYTKADRLRVQR